MSDDTIFNAVAEGFKDAFRIPWWLISFQWKRLYTWIKDSQP